MESSSSEDDFVGFHLLIKEKENTASMQYWEQDKSKESFTCW